MELGRKNLGRHHLSDAQENTNVKQKQMTKTAQNLKMEFSEKSTRAEVKIKLKTLITQPENSKANESS